MEEEPADQPANGKRRIVSAVRAPLILTVALIAAVGGGYYAFYRSQVEYYTGRNLRLVSTLAAQIGGRVAMYSQFFRDGILKPEGSKRDDPPVAQQESIFRSAVETSRGWAVRLHTRSGQYADVPIDEVLRPIFTRRVGLAFDMVLVADERGEILYSFRTPPPASSLLTNEQEQPDEEGLSERTQAMLRSVSRARKERESGSALVVTRLGAMSERKGWREYKPLHPGRLLVATEQIRVRLGEADYLLFAQPYTFARTPTSPQNVTRRWIVCGLVSAPRFRYSVTAVSASTVLVAVGVALLALCCWPFLRIALIHPNQELTITDVALIVICTAVGACVLTLALLDVFAYRRLAGRADEQLRNFSGIMVADFQSNVQRAMTVLDRAQAHLPKDAHPEKISQPLPPALMTPEIIGEYPYVDSIAWINKDGKHHARFAPIRESERVPLADVSQRQYFRDARVERTWTVGGRPYVLEWVRSRTTGDVRAVLAKNTGDPNLPVIALATDLIDITHAVRPPGVEMAIIDETGEVIYHSDTERIGYENFFAETDRNRNLRSAVLARHDSHVDATYWGEDKTMYVRPLTGSRWTLVAFRAKRLARVLNVESSLLTLVLLLISAAPYVLLYILVLVMAPRYRAPSLWPDESRGSDYLRLCLIYLALLVLFGLTTYVLMPWSSVYAVMLIPALAILSTYLVVHRVGSPRRFAIAAALWVVVNAMLFTVLLRNDVAAGRFFSRYEVAAKVVLVAVAVAVATLTAILITTTRGGLWARSVLDRVPFGYTTLYRLCGVLILVLCAALPVAAFFNISRHVQWELLVKYGQLRAAADLEHRIDRLETLNVRADSTSRVYQDVLREDLSRMSGSTWELRPIAGVPPVNPLPYVKCDTSTPSATHQTIPAGAARSLLPALYEDSIAIRPLYERAADQLWQWCVDHDSIVLARKVRFDVAVSQKIWPNRPTPTNQQIIISSARTPRLTDAASVVPVMLLCGLGILAVFWFACGFIASRVLLMDVTEPHWMARLPLSPTLGDHIFLVRRDKDAATLTGPDPMGKGLPFLDIPFAKLDADDDWLAALERLDSSAAGRNVRVVDFEYGINDGAINLRKLAWLEKLLSLPDRTVIVVSTVTPAFVLTTPPPNDAPTDYFARWRALLDRFVIMTAEELELRHQEWKRRQEFRSLSQLPTPKGWLEKETAYNPFLRRLRDELDPDAGRTELLDEIGERAETYYAGLWASCREDEKLLLDQLARNGLANGRNRRTLRRLIARGLVRRNPNLELFSETFRRYVVAAAQREDLVRRAKAERGASTWDSLRVPFFVIIIAFLLLLFTTQQDLLTTTTALATALTTGLPIIMKLIGVFAEKRMGAPDRG